MKPRFKETERMVANHALEQVAKQNGVTLEEVEMEIQQVINSAIQVHPQKCDSLIHFVPSEGTLPSPQEVIMWYLQIGLES